jgi:hypothetical protein
MVDEVFKYEFAIIFTSHNQVLLAQTMVKVNLEKRVGHLIVDVLLVTSSLRKKLNINLVN